MGYKVLVENWNDDHVHLVNMITYGGWAKYTNTVHTQTTVLTSIFHSLTAWFCCLSVFGMGSRFLNKPSRILTYLNQAVYPFYIFHMTLILMSLYYLKDVEILWQFKLILISLITGFGCLALFELVKRHEVTQLFFGIKEK